MKKKIFKNPSRHKFFLNPYIDVAFTRCPKCDNKTKVKKVPMVIDADKKGLVNLNMETKYCPYCDLIIAKKEKLELLVSQAIQQPIDAAKCFVFGTLDNPVFRKFLKEGSTVEDLLNNVYPFKDVLSFKIQPAGWYLNDTK